MGDSIEAFQSEKPLVLIVDDSEMNRAILSEMLKDEYCILEADNGRTALDMVDRYGDELSLVLLDIVMPGASGFEVLGRSVAPIGYRQSACHHDFERRFR